MVDTSEYSEVSQLRTRCTILESQIQVLEKQNYDLKATITILHPDNVSSTNENMKTNANWKEVDKVGKFPQEDDGDFQL